MTTTLRPLSTPRTAVFSVRTSPAAAAPASPPRQLDGFSSGHLTPRALQSKLTRAQDLMAFRLGAVRATVLTAPAQNLSAAAIASEQRELVHAGTALKKSNEKAVAASLERGHLEALVARRPADAKLKRELAAAQEQERTLNVEVNEGARDVRRLLSTADVDTLAKIQIPLHGFQIPEVSTLKHALEEVRSLRAQLDPRNV